jgi:hypothetical protein
MGKDSIKEIPWAKVVAKTEEISGIPRKQLDEVSNQLAVGIDAVIEEHQPKRDGDRVDIMTPFATYGMIRNGAQNQMSPDGVLSVRPACVGMNIAIPRRFINAANIGLIDKATEESEKKKAKTA